MSDAKTNMFFTKISYDEDDIIPSKYTCQKYPDSCTYDELVSVEAMRPTNLYVATEIMKAVDVLQRVVEEPLVLYNDSNSREGKVPIFEVDDGTPIIIKKIGSEEFLHLDPSRISWNRKEKTYADEHLMDFKNEKISGRVYELFNRAEYKPTGFYEWLTKGGHDNLHGYLGFSMTLQGELEAVKNMKNKIKTGLTENGFHIIK